ncbi:transcriptional regulator [Oceanobacillus chungangensis]|uniref:Transcriptional regulator n=2 Tax=Oceanobacillus chungangensis TaxID=1229152 RepID=A0A3D8PSW7_9BACI|nr:transcriptional regulator [Oceanobacillus chungangensis]
MAFNNFGEYVRKVRKQYGMSLQDLADRTNLSPSFIYRIEVGKRQALLNSRLVILLCGFDWDTEKLMAYLEKVLMNIEEFKRITN